MKKCEKRGNCRRSKCKRRKTWITNGINTLVKPTKIPIKSLITVLLEVSLSISVKSTIKLIKIFFNILLTIINYLFNKNK